MKENKDDKFSNILGDKLRSVSEEPPVGMFERIEQTLHTMEVSAAETSSADSRRAVVVPLWQRPAVRGLAAAMVAAMLTLVVVVALRENAPEEMRIMAEQSVEQPQAEQVAPTPEVAPEVEKVAAVAPRLTRPATVAEVVNIQIDESVMMGTQHQPSEEQAVGSDDSSSEQAPSEQSIRRERRKERRTRSSRQNQQELEDYWRSVLSKEEPQRGVAHIAEIGIYAQNVGFDNGNIERNNLANNPMMVKEQNATAGGGSYLAPSLVNADTRSKLKHFMPVTVGVTLSYPLNDWLSVESGLLYTNVYSKSDSSGAISSYERRRTLDYLGVPIALSLYFADIDRLSFYGRLGGTLEMNIGAKDQTFMDGRFVEKLALDVPAFTFSLDAAVGANVALWGGIGLFGEVGCTYWSAQKGYVENYRTVHPLSLSTRFGLRYTFN